MTRSVQLEAERTGCMEHQIEVAAPAAAVYRLLAEVANWPVLFPPTVHVERLERTEPSGGEVYERIRIWATANGEAKNWTSRRVLDPHALRIDFRQEVSAPPVAAMGGSWLIEPISGDGCRVRLLHDFQAVGDDPAGVAWIRGAVDLNSRSELAALKTSVELATGAASELRLSFEDTVWIAGAVGDVYDFLNDAHLWLDRLPHVARVELQENSPGLQVLEMDTRTKDGSTHTTKSVRVCFPPGRIVYKQVTLPALMTLHTGHWTLREADGGVSATSQHTVVLNPATIPAVLGVGAGVPQARDFVRAALSTNSMATLRLAKQYAEGRRDRR